ncbi:MULTISPECIES: DUF6318 family protein [Actinomyces]|uniref:DUF6318 domain-containing protein n=1 Tax=Actinomyces respiraculi TaxID=2744574 RepID=A0A7T0LMG8_9ACTO|nr:MULTISPECIES: DUF6318 family protein [Actinomyces]QPL06347.1 hypothetical protein ID810_05490 [Actinomyces respiraculi]
MSLRFLRPDPHGRTDEPGQAGQAGVADSPGLAGLAGSCGLVVDVRGGQADDVEAVAQARRAWRRFLVLMVVLVVVCAAAGAGAARWWSSHRPRDPYPWETSVASNYRPPTTTPTPELTPEPTPTSTSTSSSLLSAEEQALREAALATPAPERPATIDQFTPEGAIAAAEYFMALYPYVHATGDLSAWQAMSTQDCQYCSNISDRVTRLHQGGGWWDPWQHELTVTEYGTSQDDDTIWVVAVTISYPASMKHDGVGGSTATSPDTASLYIQVHWTGQSWLVEEGQAA